ncbi:MULTISPECIES: hypothetical protein [unclassified Nocardiopsis]|uniref:SbtR family transcriptional regulator n=1 Tax=Nocardiopsis TaxID=2013 RepID=UPI00387B12B0
MRESAPELEHLLSLAREAGTVRPGLETGDVVALLTAACHGALHGGWDDRTRARALGVVFAGMRADRA